uniref:Uncharacterized protein n=1 Tax=Strombidium rassoulzadegani TaxID=1082188 RepID=A0A7S3CU83_9SPIT
MANNKELVEMVELYESSWTLGRDQLLDQGHRLQIVEFCFNLESLCEKYPLFKEQVECSEAEIFLSIPSLIVLKSIQNDELSLSHLQLSKRFAQPKNGQGCPIDFEMLQSDYDSINEDQETVGSQLEEFIIRDDLKVIEQQYEKNNQTCKQILSLGQKVKQAGMELSRQNAQEFNSFITAALGE